MRKPTEIENKKVKDAKKYKAIFCMTCRTGYRSSEKFWSMKVLLQCQKQEHQHTSDAPVGRGSVDSAQEAGVPRVAV